MLKKQNELGQVPPAETAVAQSMTEQVLAPGKPDMLFVDGGCSNWPYVFDGRNASTREFGGGQYVALDGGKSEFLDVPGERSMSGWDQPDMVEDARKKVEAARSRGINAQYLREDLKALRFADDSVDELFLADVMLAPGLSNESIASIVEEASRVVKTGGMFVIKETEVRPDSLQKQSVDTMREYHAQYEHKGKPDWSKLRAARALQKYLEQFGFEFEIHDTHDNPELIDKLNAMYRTSDYVKNGVGVYILARKVPEVIRIQKDWRGLRRFLGHRSLA